MQAMKYLLAVVVALFSQTHGTFLKHTEKTADCAVCANQNLCLVASLRMLEMASIYSTSLQPATAKE